IYMSKDALYITYLRQKTQTQIVMDFLAAEADQFFDPATAEKIQQLPSQELSHHEKRERLASIIDNATRNMTYEQRQQFQRQIENAFENYTRKHRRDFTTTGIVKIPAGNIRPAATGTVPGRILNQFSIDEYRNHLRVATTVGIPGSFTSRGSVNDVYVLDQRLSRTGAVQGLGLNERIYAVRFIRDHGYVVTFRRIDPLHVLDLSQPSSPTLKGTLKLPGFSSYLHPLSQDRILGIGEEDGRVKAVVFDVSNASSPVVEDDLILEDYSSQISQTHHAFMIDRKHKVFFLPGTSTGYIISYRDELEIVKTVPVQEPLRARYVNDYLYIFGSTQLTVVDETNWTIVDTVQLTEQRRVYR
ncbi:MAG: beta-propeller domain-containing protein, partial [Candidatus Nanohaloarchaea archaeon]|nr:beta-propeller domain-containing protein [Candidatus Nanohaloarchaea archaeon]